MKKLVILIFSACLGIFIATLLSGQPSVIIDSLRDLFDVSISNPQDDEVLTYNSATGKWDNEAASAGAGGWTDGGTKVYLSTPTDSVGIGNTAPEGMLDVGTIPGIGFIVKTSGNVGIKTTNPLGLLQIGTQPNPALLVTNSNVGIGVTSPIGLLQVGTNPAKPGLLVLPNNNVGIGWTSPVGLLQVSTTPSSGLVVLPNGNVGIGITNPAVRLQVVGDYVRIGDGGTISFTSGDGDLYVEDVLEVDGDIRANIGNAYLGSSTISGTMEFQDAIPARFGAGSETGIMWSTTGNDSLRIETDCNNAANSGNILITDLNGYLTDFGQPNVIDPHLRIQSSDTTSVNDFIQFWHDETDANIQTGSGKLIFTGNSNPGDLLHIKTSGSGTNVALRISNTKPADVLGILDNGNIGIATTAPVGLFQVGTSPGAILVALSNGNVGIGTTAPYGLLQAGNTFAVPALIVTTGQNVGIGTTNPTYKFQVTGGDARFDEDVEIGGNLNAVVDQTITGNVGISGNLGVGITVPSFRLQVGTTPGLPLLAVLDNGNIGIGTSDPTGKLKIIGNVISDTGTFTDLIISGTASSALLASNTGSFSTLLLAGTNVANTLALNTLIISGTNTATTLKTSNIVADTGTLTTLLIAGTNAATNLASGTGTFTNLIISGTASSALLASNTGAFTTLRIAGTVSSALLASNTGSFSTLLIAGTNTATKLITTSLGTKDTLPIMSLVIKNPDNAFNKTGRVYSTQKTMVIDKMETICPNVTSGTGVIFSLKTLDTDGTGVTSSLSIGQTSTIGKLIVTSFTGGTLPSGQTLVIDDIIQLSNTVPLFRLDIFGHEQ